MQQVQLSLITLVTAWRVYPQVFTVIHRTADMEYACDSSSCFVKLDHEVSKKYGK